MDKARVLVTIGELAQFKEVHQIVLSTFKKEVYKEVVVIEGGEVLDLRSEEQGTQQLFFEYCSEKMIDSLLADLFCVSESRIRNEY